MMEQFHLSTRGLFEGYASVFDLPDLARDVVIRGAYRESLKRTGAAGVRFLWQHNPAEPVGVWRELREDSKGLFAVGALNLETQRGSELFSLIRQGAVDGLSIGFRVKQFRKSPRLQGRELLSVDLWEISLVSFPLLLQARLIKPPIMADSQSTKSSRPRPLSH